MITYPGTLDEYLWAMRERAKERDRAREGRGTGSGTPAAAASPTPADAAETSRRRRAEDKERKRREAELRQERSKKLAPLTKRVTELEARIDALEKEQKRIGAELEDPSVYTDDARRFALLTELQVNQSKLDELTERWAGVQEELEAAERELA